MHTTLIPEQADLHEVLIARADEELAHAREQITRVDEQIERVHQQLFKLDHDATRRPSDPQNPLKTFRSVPSDRPWLRGLIVLLLAAFICVTAIAWQSSYGNAARLTVAQWAAPQFASTSLLSPGKPEPKQPSHSIVQVAAAEPPTPQPTPSAQVAPQDVAPTAGSMPPELAQLLQTMARDLANVEQGVEQLKAGLEQMTSDNAKALEQLKDNQEQMANFVARASEQNLQPKPSAPPPRQIVTLTRKPVSTLHSPQVTAPSQSETQPQARIQPQAEEPQPPPLALRPPMAGR